MRRKAALGAAAAAAVAVGLAAAPAADASTPSWQLAYHGAALPSGSHGLVDVTAINATNAWAVGDKGTGTARRPTFLHWDGHTWSNYSNTSLGKIPGIAQFDPMTISSTAANNVWIFGSSVSNSAVVYHGSGEWTAVALPGAFQQGMIAVVSPTNVWGVTSSGCGPTGYQQCVEYWNGRTWHQSTVSGDIQSVTTDGKYVYILALTGVKQVGEYSIGTPVIYRPASTMQVTAGPKLQIMAGTDTLVQAKNGHKYLQAELTSAGHPERVWNFNGSTWSQMTIGSNGFLDYNGIVSDGGNGFWGAAGGCHWTGTAWVISNNLGYSISFDNTMFSLAPASTGPFWLFETVAPIPGTSDVWAAGEFANTKNVWDMMADYPAIP